VRFFLKRQSASDVGGAAMGKKQGVYVGESKKPKARQHDESGVGF